MMVLMINFIKYKTQFMKEKIDDQQTSLEHLMKKCTVNLYYQHPQQSALGFGRAYIVSQNVLLTPARNLYDRILKKYHENIEIQLVKGQQKQRFDCKQSEIIISQSFKEGKTSAFYDLAIIRFQEKILQAPQFNRQNEVLLSNMKGQLRSLIDNLNKKDKQLVQLHQKYLQELDAKNLQIQSLRKQIQKEKAKEQDDDSFVSLQSFEQHDNVASINPHMNSVMTKPAIPLLQILQNNGNNINIQGSHNKKLAVSKQIDLKIHFNLQSNWTLDFIKIQNNSIKRLSGIDGSFKKIILSKPFDSASFLNFKLIKYGVNSLISFGILAQGRIHDKFSGQTIDQKQTVTFWSDPKDKDGWIRSNGQMKTSHSSLYWKQKESITLKFDQQNQQVSFIKNGQNYSVRVQTWGKDKIFYGFIALWSKDDEVQVSLKSNI